MTPRTLLAGSARHPDLRRIERAEAVCRDALVRQSRRDGADSEAIRVHGIVSSGYRIDVRQPPASRAACSAPVPELITTGDAGAVQRVTLVQPPHGWCRGRYRVTVLLDRGPYCPPPPDGQPPPPCPEFSSQELDTGHARFLVRRHP